MPRWNTPVRDWTVFYKHGKYRFGEKTLQSGVTIFGRKKKNGNRLASSATIRRSIAKTAEQEKGIHCALAFPKINLGNSAKTPRVTIILPKPPTEGKMTTPAIG